MNPLRYPRPWTRLAGVLALGCALWLLLVPRTALYYVDGRGAPYDIDVTYAWGQGTGDQVLLLPAGLFGEEDPVAGGDGLVTSVRLDCGLVFTSGENEADRPAGEAACSSMETPRLTGGIGLGVLGIAGCVAAGRLPSVREARVRTGTGPTRAMW